MAHGLETVIAAAEKLHLSHPEVRFLLVGEGAERERIVAMAEARQLTNVRFIGQQPREKIPEYIAASDACLVVLKKSDVFETVIPTKMLEFMSCARPVILGVAGQARKILEEAGSGIYFEPGNADALADSVLRLKADRVYREALGRNGRTFILRNLSRERTATEYLMLIAELCGENLLKATTAAA
jgi:glycosyltransferase involved in cell wall biosynthesis